MKAEDLIKLLESHIGEDIKVGVCVTDSFEGLMYITADIKCIKGNVLGAKKIDKKHLDYLDDFDTVEDLESTSIC